MEPTLTLELLQGRIELTAILLFVWGLTILVIALKLNQIMKNRFEKLADNKFIDTINNSSENNKDNNSVIYKLQKDVWVLQNPAKYKIGDKVEVILLFTSTLAKYMVIEVIVDRHSGTCADFYRKYKIVNIENGELRLEMEIDIKRRDYK